MLIVSAPSSRDRGSKDSQASQVGTLGDFQASEKHCLRNGWMGPEG